MNWDEFAAKIEAGTQAMFLSRYSQRWAEGIILENKPYGLMDREEKSVFTQDALRFQHFASRDDIIPNLPFHIEVERALYLINGEWMTLIQVLMLA